MKKIIRIKKIGEIITGNTPPTNMEDYYGNEYPFIKATDIDVNKKYTLKTEQYYSNVAFKKYRKSLIPKGSTCVVTIGTVGKKMTMAHTDLFINQAINAIIPNDKFDKEYIYYLLKNNLIQLKTFDSGTTSGRENISKSAFSNIQLQIDDDIIIQKKIGSILSKYDKLIEINNHKIELLEKYSRILFKKNFIDSIKVDDKEWEYIELKDLVKRRNYPIKKFDQWKDLDLIDLSRMKGFSITVSDFGKGYELNSNVKEVKKYDLLVGSIRSYQGKNAFSPIDGCIAGSVYNFMPKESYMYGYLLMLINNKDFIKWTDNFSNGTKMPVINYKDLVRFKCHIPKNKEILKEFNKIILYNVKLISNLIKQNIFLTKQRDLLLPRLMSGKLEVK